MKKTSRNTIEFSAAELRLLLRVLRLMYKVEAVIGYGPEDGVDAEAITIAIEAMLQRRNIHQLVT